MSYPDLTRILGLRGYEVTRYSLDEGEKRLVLYLGRKGKRPRYLCPGCGRRRHKWKDRRRYLVEDLPWGENRVQLVVDKHRVMCPRCGVRTERLPFVRERGHVTIRMEALIGRECQSQPVSHVAKKWGLGWERTKNIDKSFLREWDQSRRRRPLRHLGIDEVSRQKGHKYYTVFSNLDSGEVIDLRLDRDQSAPDSFFRDRGRKKRSIRAACIDMWPAYEKSVRDNVPQALIIYDKFHVMKHVAKAVDETRREEFFRQGKKKRAFIKGKRWLFLTRWTNLSEEGRIRLEEAFRVNRRMFKAYFLKEDLSRLWEFASPEAARRFFHNWVQNIRWQRIPAFWKLAQTLRVHLEGIVNFCQENVRFGVVEAINTTVKSVMRRGRGYRDHEYLKLKLMWITANPVIHT